MTQINKKLNILIFSIIIFLLVAPAPELMAAMKSDSYVIYENVMHSFDGPVISNINHSVSGQTATITWNTNIIADSFVIYDTDNTFSSTKEQGSHAKTGTSHSVDAVGLDPSTTYYYKVRSQRVNGGITTDTNIGSFTTEAAEEPTPVIGGGGGILVIDKTDKEPPVITSLEFEAVSDDSATIKWITDEEATSFVEYGSDESYGSIYGQWGSSTEHSVALSNLNANRIYHFRALSSDSWGNVGYSEDTIFTTAEGIIEEEEEPEVPPTTEDEESILARTTERIYEFIDRLFPGITPEDLGPDPLTTLDSLEELTGLMPYPIFVGDPDVEVGADKVKISWRSDIEANSLVAIAPEESYNPDAAESYLQIVGNFDTYSRDHEVDVYNLSPKTTYHFQLRSNTRFGPTSSSRDFTFRTSIEELEITSFFSQIIDNQTAVFKWVTNKEADSSITFAPYRGNVLAIDQSKTVKETAVSVIHEVEISEFEAGTFYEVELTSVDTEGNVATEVLERFSTSEDDLPPVVSHIKADSTVFVDRGNKIQTIISWLSNEPSASRVYFQEGVHGLSVELSEATDLNMNYTKEHVMVITKFKPGIVYTFRVESIDSGGNTVISRPHTFMTAKKRESIIQIIMRILEDTFGWIKKIV